MDDVLIVGAGPAGAVAAIVLARAGARVRVIDRAAFPRDKLCGDTLNPGTLAILARLDLAATIERRGLRLEGMLVTGPRGAAIDGRYPRGLHGCAIRRSVLDQTLVDEAVRAGARFHPEVAAREPLVGEGRFGRRVSGVIATARGVRHRWPARIVIAADGRQSALATSLGLLRQRMAPRRWAIGAYFEESRPAQPLGEMHIRKGRYIGVSPLSDRVSNVCLVKPSGPADPDVRRAEATLRRELSANPELSDRFAGARLVRPPIVLGPLAADPTGHAIDGVIVAGDAAGFIDPMTGDGLRFAVRGGELAASASLDALAHGWTGVHTRLAGERHREFGAKWRFNRALRGAVSSHPLLDSASLGARLAPWLVRAIIRYAGDCGLAATTAQTRELEIANCRLQI